MSSHAHGSSVTTGSLPPCRHIKVNLGDPSIVKHTLDEQAAMYLLDQGYVEDVTLSNLKLGLGLFAVALTIFSQFYPSGTPFPECAPFLKGCVLLYFALQGVLQLLHLLVEKDCILLTKRRTEATTTDEKTDEKKQIAQGQQQQQGGKKKKGGGVVASSAPTSSASSSADASTPTIPNLPPFALSLQAALNAKSAVYDLTLATRSSESLLASLRGSSSSSNSGIVGDGGIPQVAVSVSLNVTDYFDVNGIFLMERYQAALKELIHAFAAEVAKVDGGRGSGESKKEK